ncbi:1205_t:CDS:2 [Rhizophagus irregularis]|nr:1205_t:CDS:2 [Rhizophagus irregularis]
MNVLRISNTYGSCCEVLRRPVFNHHQDKLKALLLKRLSGPIQSYVVILWDWTGRTAIPDSEPFSPTLVPAPDDGYSRLSASV